MSLKVTGEAEAPPVPKRQAMPRSLCRAPAYGGVLPGQVPVFAPSDKETEVQRGSNLTPTYTVRGMRELLSVWWGGGVGVEPGSGFHILPGSRTEIDSGPAQ